MTKKTESTPARAMKTTETLKVTMPSDREIAMTRVFDGSHSMIFDALTKPSYSSLGCSDRRTGRWWFARLISRWAGDSGTCGVRPMEWR